MGIISMIVVGFIIGLIARAIMPGDQKLGLILTTVLGIVGSAWPATWAARWASINPARGRAGSAPSSAP